MDTRLENDAKKMSLNRAMFIPRILVHLHSRYKLLFPYTSLAKKKIQTYSYYFTIKNDICQKKKTLKQHVGEYFLIGWYRRR